MFNAWHEKLTANGYLFFFVYLIAVAAASYHFAYGIWNFCIRWGITISERAQIKVQKFAFAAFIVVTLLGWSALVGFLIPKYSEPAPSVTAMTNSPGAS
jgi:succinate dehydrogenase / fumarate reductase cytochrome b subunit